MAYAVAQLIEAMKKNGALPLASPAGPLAAGFVPRQRGGSQPPFPGPVPSPPSTGNAVPLPANDPWRFNTPQPETACREKILTLLRQIEGMYGVAAGERYLPMLLERMWQCEAELKAAAEKASQENERRLLATLTKGGPPIGQR
jgi:hypothetical protein